MLHYLLKKRIAKAKTRPGNSTKEIARLEKLKEERNQVQILASKQEGKKNKPDYNGRGKNK